MFSTVIKSPAVNVVQNNNGISSEKSYSEQIEILLQKLSKERKAWEEGAYRKSNDELYAILTKCYAISHEIDTTSNGAKEMRAAINKFAKSLGYSFREGTPVINRIVRCVFGDVGRSRISTYCLVLREAKRKNIAIGELANFIEQSGGIQEIRLSKSATYKTPAEKAAIVSQSLPTETLAEVRNDAMAQLAKSEHMDELCVLIATQTAAGTFKVHSVVRSKQALNSALLANYSAQQASKHTDGEAANDNEVRVDLISKIFSRA